MLSSTIPSLLGMAGTLALAFGFDRWLVLQQRYARQYSDFSSYMIWMIVEGFALCFVWIAFSWIVLSRKPQSRLAPITFIVIGILIFIWFPIEFLPLHLIPPFLFFSTRYVNLQYTGLFLVFLGFLVLFLPTRYRPAG